VARHQSHHRAGTGALPCLERSLVGETHLQPLGERYGGLDRRQIVREQQRASDAGVERGAVSTQPQMPSHRLDVDTAQRVVNICVVLASKLPTIHAARGMG